MTEPEAAAPGWRPDPTGRHEFRYWHSGSWTNSVSDHGAVTNDPSDPAFPALPGQPALPGSPGASPGPGTPESPVPPGRRAWWTVGGATVLVLMLIAGVAGWFLWLRPGPGPVELAATEHTSTSVSLSWSRPATGTEPEGYLIRRDGHQVAETGPEPEFTDSGLRPLTSYRYEVIALVDGARTQPSPDLTVRTRQAAPTTFTSAEVSTDSAVLTWQPPPGTAPDHYVVVRNGTDVGTVPAGTLTYRDTTLTPGSSYAYDIVAITEGQRSDPATGVTVTTRTPPLEQARLQGTWTATLTVTKPGQTTLKKGQTAQDPWAFAPSCAQGPCPVRLSGSLAGEAFTLNLKRDGARYSGSAKVNLVKCGETKVTNTIKVTVTVTQGKAREGTWTASAWSGTFALSIPETRTGQYRCPAQSFEMSVASEDPGSSVAT
jgi:hypothetical protein